MGTRSAIAIVDAPKIITGLVSIFLMISRWASWLFSKANGGEGHRNNYKDDRCDHVNIDTTIRMLSIWEWFEKNIRVFEKCTHVCVQTTW